MPIKSITVINDNNMEQIKAKIVVSSTRGNRENIVLNSMVCFNNRNELLNYMFGVATAYKHFRSNIKVWAYDAETGDYLHCCE